MFSNAKELNGYKLIGRDGEVGKVKELYFDDRHWTVRYLVAETGTWLSERQVLISPHALRGINKETEDVSVGLTRKQIEDSPAVDTDMPVSRQREQELHSYYGWSPYWSMGTYAGVGFPVPGSLSGMVGAGDVAMAQPAGDPSLRNMQEVRGYTIQSTNGEIGHVEDFVIDDETWAIRYLIVDTQNWWSGKKVLISPQWIERVSWDESTVFINLSREAIRQSPEYTEESLLTRDYEIRLHGHYNRDGYWDAEAE